jgi:hypothetical protein
MNEKVSMPRGRKTSLTITLTDADRQTLLAWQRSTTIPAGRALLVSDTASRGILPRSTYGAMPSVYCHGGCCYAPSHCSPARRLYAPA